MSNWPTYAPRYIRRIRYMYKDCQAAKRQYRDSRNDVVAHLRSWYRRRYVRAAFLRSLVGRDTPLEYAVGPSGNYHRGWQRGKHVQTLCGLLLSQASLFIEIWTVPCETCAAVAMPGDWE